jgi:hypothetical protein
MPERLDTVTVQTARGSLPLPWDSRQTLLAEILRDDALRPTVVAFEAVGATRPVEIPPEQVGRLIDALDAWAAKLGCDIPEGIAALREALAADGA